MGITQAVSRLWANEVDDLEAGPDQRMSVRHAVLFKASIYPIDEFYDFVVHDASLTGIQGEVDLELSLGQILHVSFDEKSYQSGRVRWTRDGRFGLEMDDDLKLSAPTELDTGLEPEQQTRAKRVGLNIAARLGVGRPSRPGTVRNISRTGMLLETTPGLLTGQTVIVQMAHGTPALGRVQWAKAGQLGIKFV